jgi:hypothetical protein
MEIDFSKNIKDSQNLGDIFSARKSQAHLNELSDNDFAYIEAGGTRDWDNKTVPRSLRHFPVSTEEEVAQSIKALEVSSLSSGMQIQIFDSIRLSGEKLGIKSEAGLPPWLKKKSDDKKSDDKKSDDKKSDDKKSDDKKSDDKDESKAELSEKQKKLPPAIQKSILEKQKKSGDKDSKEDSKEDPKEESDAMKMEKDDAMMKKMYSRMDEIDKARKDMDKEYAMIKDKLGAMMKKVKASSSKND